MGTPAPQGSKKHVGKGIMVESSKYVAPWREAVAWQAREASGGKTYPEAIVSLRFVLSAPKYTTTDMQRPVDRQKLAPWRHTKKPDIDKLARSTLDALVTAGLLPDDAEVWSLTAEKRYAAPGEATGCLVEVSSAAVEVTP